MSAEIKTRPIGERFEYEGAILEVVESRCDCIDCYFKFLRRCPMLEMGLKNAPTLLAAGSCEARYRTDNKNVKFKKVEKYDAL